MPPKSNSSNKEELRFYASPELIEHAKEIAEMTGRSYSEFNRACWERGLAEYASDHTKLLVNQKMRRQSQPIESKGEQGENHETSQ